MHSHLIWGGLSAQSPYLGRPICGGSPEVAWYYCPWEMRAAGQGLRETTGRLNRRLLDALPALTQHVWAPSCFVGSVAPFGSINSGSTPRWASSKAAPRFVGSFRNGRSLRNRNIARIFMCFRIAPTPPKSREIAHAPATPPNIGKHFAKFWSGASLPLGSSRVSHVCVCFLPQCYSYGSIPLDYTLE